MCWFIGATTWIDLTLTDQLQKRAVSEYHDCQQRTFDTCSAKFAKDFRVTTYFHWRAALYALIPIPIVWLIIFVFVALVRWPGSTDEAE